MKDLTTATAINQLPPMRIQTDQNMTFSENCSCRAVPVPTRLELAPAIVWPMRPKLVLGVQLAGEVAVAAATDVQMPLSGFAKLG
jgi:hypothetical protein